MTSILTKTLWVSVVALFVGAPVLADDAETLDKITVSGEGKVSAPPDMAGIQTGVVTQAETAQEALRMNNAAMEELLAVLKKHNVADKDVQTSGFNVNPVYRQGKRGEAQEVSGYRVQNQVHVKVRNLPDLGKVLDALVQSGSNQISNISFGVDDQTGLLNQARSRAIQDAKSRAGVYAQAAGMKVGRVRAISEQPLAIPRPMMGRMMMAEAASSVPVATGELDFSVTVNVVFDIVPE